MALVASLVMAGSLIAVGAYAWYFSSRVLAGSPGQRRRLMRWSTVVSVGIGVSVLVFGLVWSALTGYWLILIPTWAFGVLHTNFAVRAWLRWVRRSAAL